MFYHHKHVILIRIAEIAITASAAVLAAHSAHQPGNGLVVPTNGHPVSAPILAPRPLAK